MYDIEQAIVQEDVAEVKRILEEEPSKIDLKDAEGTLMSFLAARTGNLALVRYVVEYSRASMNIVDDKHRNILHYGVMSGSVEVCRYLVEKVGMSPVAGDFDLETPYELAARLGFEELVAYFEQYVGVALRDMYDEGTLLSYLYPFSNAFYRQFGYELGCDILKFPYHGKWQKHVPTLLALSLPSYAIITDSAKNPADDRVLDALNTMDVATLRTMDGPVHLFTDGLKVTVR